MVYYLLSIIPENSYFIRIKIPFVGKNGYFVVIVLKLELNLKKEREK